MVIRRNPPYSLVSILLFVTIIFSQACIHLSKPDKKEEIGLASWYGKKFHGRKTASGEIYNMFKFTAAHKTLPLGIKVKVTNLSNGRNVIVRINDRGPFVEGRIIDLSYAAALKLKMVKMGTAKVRLHIIR